MGPRWQAAEARQLIRYEHVLLTCPAGQNGILLELLADRTVEGGSDLRTEQQVTRKKFQEILGAPDRVLLKQGKIVVLVVLARCKEGGSRICFLAAGHCDARGPN